MDIEYLLLLQNFRNATLEIFNNFFTFITNIAVDQYIIAISLIIFWIVDKKKGKFVYLSLGLGCFLNALLKVTFCIYRPWIRDSRVEPPAAVKAGATGYSFPSGHSTCTSSTYFPIAARFKKYKSLVIFCFVMVLLTMFSRNYMGVHTPQDVLVGCGLGIVSTFTILKVEQYLDKHPEKDWIFVLISAIMTIGILLYVSLKSYPETYVDGKLLVDPAKMRINSFSDPGLFFGGVLALYIEKHFIKLDISGTKFEKLMRAAIGFILLVFYCTTMSALVRVVNINIVYFLYTSSIPIIFMCLYPLTWKRKNKKKENI